MSSDNSTSVTNCKGDSKFSVCGNLSLIDDSSIPQTFFSKLRVCLPVGKSSPSRLYISISKSK